MAVSLEEASSLILQEITTMPVMSLPLAACYGRILAHDVIADTDFPPFDRSPLDGYAVKFADVQGATSDQPVRLRITADVPAGIWPQVPVVAGTAVRIMTGAKVPDGADAVVRLEDTERRDDWVQIFAAAGTDQNICCQGEEIRSGTRILQPGDVLQDGALGILALLGHHEPHVYARPRVAILATGTEVIGVDQPLTPGKIRDSNSYMLAAKVREAGGEPVLLGQVPDKLADIEARLKQAGDVDLYITTGGASVGDYDLMEQLFERLSIQALFKRVAIKPGMPVLAGSWQQKMLIALSGNPAAAGVSFEVLVRPLVRKMAGAKVIDRIRAEALLTQEIVKAGPVRRFVWAKGEYHDGRLMASPLMLQRNGMLSGLLAANMLIDIPANHEPLAAGTNVEVLLL